MSRGLIEAGRAGAGVSRRSFLKLGMSLGAAAGGGLLLGFSMPAAGDDARRSVIGGDAAEPAQPGVFAPNAFVQIDRAGKVTLVMPKVEMGQGVYTALPMLIAEELEVPLSSVTLDHAPPNEKLFLDPLLGGQLTGGSTSVRYAWSCGVPAPPRARCWSRPPRSNGTSIRQPAAPRTRSAASAERPARIVRPARRCGGEAAGAEGRRAEAAGGFQADRHAREAARFAGEGRRHRAVQPTCACPACWSR